MTDLSTIGFKADVSGLKLAQRELDNTARHGESAERKIDRSIDNTNKNFLTLKNSIGVVGAAIAALGSAALARDIVRYSDSWKSVTSQLRQVTESEAELARVRQMVLQVSRDTRSELEATTGLYAALDRATTQLGLNTERQIELTRTINNLFVAGGKSAQEASGAIRQLVQGLEAGALRGDEFNSVAENAPRILDALAASTGMARGQLREFAATGGITAEILVKALESYSETAQKMADQTEKTFGQSLENATTNTTAFVGNIDTLNRSVSAAGQGIEDFSAILLENVSSVNKVLLDLERTFAIGFARIGGFFDVIAAEMKFAFAEPIDFIEGKILDLLTTLAGLGNDALQFLGLDWLSSIEGQLERFRETSIREHNAALNGIRDKTTETVRLLNSSYDKLIEKTSTEMPAAQEKTSAALDRTIKSVAGVTKEQQKSEEQYGKQIQALDMELLKLRLSSDAYELYSARISALNSGLSPKMIADIEKRVVALQKERNALKAVDAELENLMDGELFKLGDEIDKIKDKTESWADITERSVDRIDASFADVWMNILDGADNVFSSLINSFKRMLAEMAHAAITRPIVLQIGTAFGLSGMSGAANAAGMLGGLGGGGILGPLGGGIMGIGNFIGGAFGSGFAGTGALLGAGSLSGALANVGGLFGSGSILGGLGAALPLVGIAAGGLGLINSITGGGLFGTSYKPTGNELQIGIGGGNVSGSTILEESKKKSLFRGTRRRYTETPFDTTVINDMFDAVEMSIIDAANMLDIDTVSKTVSTGFNREFGDRFAMDFFESMYSTVQVPVEDWLKQFSRSMKIDISDMSESEVQAAIQEWAAKTTDEMIRGVFGSFITQIQRDGEGASDALNRVITNMNAVGAVAEILNLSFDLTGEAAALAATNIVDLVGGLGALNTLSTQYYNSFFSEAERFDMLQGQLESSFNGLGLSLVDSRSEFRSLVEGLDLTTEAGQEMFAALMQLVPGLDQYLAYLERQKEVTEDLSLTLDPALSALKDEVEAVAERLNLSFDLTGEAAALAAKNIVDLVGGLGALNTLSTQYYNSFFSEAERFDMLQGQLESSFNGLGLSLVSSRSEFRALVEGLDLTTDAGQKMFATLMQLVPGFNQYLEYLEQQKLLSEQIADSVEAVAERLNLSFDLTGEAAALAAKNIVDLVGGLGALNTLSTQYYNSFFSEEEKFLSLQSSLSDVYGQLGLTLPTTREEFRALVDGLDLTTESGQEMFATLMKLVPGMDQYLAYLEQQKLLSEQIADSDAAKLIADAELEAREFASSLNIALSALKDAVDAEKQLAAARLESAQIAYRAEVARIDAQRSLVESQYAVLSDNVDFAKGQLQSAFDAERNAIIQARDERISALQSERSAVESNLNRFLSLAQSMNDAAGNQITVQQALNAAMRGDFSLAERLNVQEIGSEGFSSAQEREFAQAVQNAQLRQIGGLAAGRASQAELMLSSIDRQIAAQESSSQSQLEALDAQLNELLGINTEIPSITEAIKLFKEAQADLDEFAYTEQIAILDAQLAQAESAYELAQENYQAEIDRLDEIMSYAEQQVNVLLGIDTSVKSVEIAVHELGLAISAAEQMRQSNESLRQEIAAMREENKQLQMAILDNSMITANTLRTIERDGLDTRVEA